MPYKHVQDWMLKLHHFTSLYYLFSYSFSIHLQLFRLIIMCCKCLHCHKNLFALIFFFFLLSSIAMMIKKNLLQDVNLNGNWLRFVFHTQSKEPSSCLKDFKGCFNFAENVNLLLKNVTFFWKDKAWENHKIVKFFMKNVFLLQKYKIDR